MNLQRCSNCDQKLVRVAHTHITKIAGFTVADCLGCNQCDRDYGVFSLHQLAGYERRAALEILVTAKNPVSGVVLKFARKALGLRQTELAKLLDTNEQQISRWENELEIDRRLRLAVACLLCMFDRLDQVDAVPGDALEVRAP